MRKLVLSVAVLVLFIGCGLPFLILFSKISPDIVRETFAQDSTMTAIVNTTIVSLLVTIVSVLTATPLAWTLTRTDLPGRSQLRSWLCLPFAIPPYVGAIAWIFLANPTTGLLNHLLGQGTLNIYSMAGLVFVESSFLYSFVLVSTLATLDRTDSSLEEAARLSGASPLRLFFDVTLPLIRPALLSSAALVFLAVAASFGVPALIGGPARIYLVTTQIYTLQKIGSVTGLLKAGALSTVLMIAAFVLLWITQFIAARANVRSVSGKAARPSLIELQSWRIPLFTIVLAFLVIVFVLPIGGLVLSSLSQVQGEPSFANLTVGNWRRVFFEVDETGRAITNSFILSTGAATAAVVIGLLISYVTVKTRLRGRQLLDFMALIPNATPGTVIALAMIMTFGGTLFGVFPSMYNTLWLIGLAYLVKYIAFASKTTTDGYRQIDDVLAEAARVSGASWSQTMTTIWLPLLAPALVAAWFFVFMPSMSELTMTTLLTGPGLETIGTLIFQLQDYADASGGGASVLAVAVIGFVILTNSALRRLSKGKYGL